MADLVQSEGPDAPCQNNSSGGVRNIQTKPDRRSDWTESNDNTRLLADQQAAPANRHRHLDMSSVGGDEESCRNLTLVSEVGSMSTTSSSRNLEIQQYAEALVALSQSENCVIDDARRQQSGAGTPVSWFDPTDVDAHQSVEAFDSCMGNSHVARVPELDEDPHGRIDDSLPYVDRHLHRADVFEGSGDRHAFSAELTPTGSDESRFGVNPFADLERRFLQKTDMAVAQFKTMMQEMASQTLSATLEHTQAGQQALQRAQRDVSVARAEISQQLKIHADREKRNVVELEQFRQSLVSENARQLRELNKSHTALIVEQSELARAQIADMYAKNAQFMQSMIENIGSEIVQFRNEMRPQANLAASSQSESITRVDTVVQAMNSSQQTVSGTDDTSRSNAKTTLCCGSLPAEGHAVAATGPETVVAVPVPQPIHSSHSSIANEPTPLNQNSSQRIRDTLGHRPLQCNPELSAFSSVGFPVLPAVSVQHSSAPCVRELTQKPTMSEAAAANNENDRSKFESRLLDCVAELSRQVASFSGKESPSVSSVVPSANNIIDTSIKTVFEPKSHPDLQIIHSEGILPPSTDLNKIGVASQQLPHRQHNLMRPKEFDGKEPVNSYLAHFNVCAEFNNWNDDERKSWLQWSLKDRARQVLWDVPSGITLNYTELSKALRQRFGSDHQQEIYKIELENRKRKTGESVSDLMQDVRRLMVLGYSSEQSSMWESVAINSFLSSLGDPQLALEIRKRSPATLDAAYRDALLLEGYYKISEEKQDNDRTKRRDQARSTRVANDSVEFEKENSFQKELLACQKTMQNQLTQMMQQQSQQQQAYLDFMRKNSNQRQIPHHFETQTDRVPNVEARNVEQTSVKGNRMRRPRSEVQCYACNEFGHFARECEKAGDNVRTQSSSGQPSQLNGNSGVRRVVPVNTAYLSAKIGGHNCWCLLDSGSEVSILPSSWISTEEVLPNCQQLRAANGTEIDLVGEAVVDVYLNKDTVIRTRFLVSPFVDEVMLGLDWLVNNECSWQFCSRVITIRGQDFNVLAAKEGWRIRRVVLQEDVVLQPFTQQTVKAKTVYGKLGNGSGTWVTEASEIQPGIRVARTLVRDAASDVFLPVMNTSSHEVKLSTGMPLAPLEEVAIISTPTEPDADNLKHVEPLWTDVDSSVSVEDRQKLKAILNSKMYVCKECGAEKMNQRTLRAHRKRHNKTKPVISSTKPAELLSTTPIITSSSSHAETSSIVTSETVVMLDQLETVPQSERPTSQVNPITTYLVTPAATTDAERRQHSLLKNRSVIELAALRLQRMWEKDIKILQHPMDQLVEKIRGANLRRLPREVFEAVVVSGRVFCSEADAKLDTSSDGRKDQPIQDENEGQTGLQVPLPHDAAAVCQNCPKEVTVDLKDPTNRLCGPIRRKRVTDTRRVVPPRGTPESVHASRENIGSGARRHSTCVQRYSVRPSHRSYQRGRDARGVLHRRESGHWHPRQEQRVEHSRFSGGWDRRGSERFVGLSTRAASRLSSAMSGAPKLRSVVVRPERGCGERKESATEEVRFSDDEPEVEIF